MAGIQDYRIKPIDAVGDFVSAQGEGMKQRATADAAATDTNFRAAVPGVMAADPAAQNTAAALDPERFGKLQQSISALSDEKLRQAKQTADVMGALTTGLDPANVTPDQWTQIQQSAIKYGLHQDQVMAATPADIPRLRAMSEQYQAAIKAEQDARLVGAHVGLANSQAREADARSGLYNAQSAQGGFRPGTGPNGGRPLSPSVQKAEDEDIAAVQTTQTINTQLQNFSQMIDKGDLSLGPVNNFVGGWENALGTSTNNSRNLATFQATLEHLRNDSLRLNKGVQTEGDAQRAWNELVRGINDPGVVQAQLSRIMKLNAIAANQKMQLINIRRQRNNAAPLEEGVISSSGASGDGGDLPDTSGTVPTRPSGNPPNQAAIDALKANKALAPAFDQWYGPGASAKVLGQ